MATRTPKSASVTPLVGKDKVQLNLDTFENENPKEPFAFVLGGRRIVAKDPGDVHWRRLADIDDPDMFAEILLEGEEDIAYFQDYAPFPARKLNALTEAYREHYGLGNPGNSNA